MAAPSATNLPQPVPIVSDKKRKKALKNIKKKKVDRNILTKPDDDYWPVINEEENARLHEAFQRLLDNEQNLDNMKLVQKELMILKRKKWLEYLVFGINDVPRSVIKGSVAAVLIADDITPRHLVQHVATLCGTAAVPILIVSSFRQYTKQLLGFSSIAVGIRKHVGESEDNKFYEILKLVKEISENYKPPSSITQFRKAALQKRKEIKNTVSPEKTVAVKKSTPSTDLYLYRTSHASRVFVPESQKVESSSPKIVQKPKMEDFMSLGDIDWDMDLETDTPLQGISYTMVNPKKKPKLEPITPSYQPLKYVKVKPNPNKKSH
ncbi:hypothetical protein R5R35_004237 [Gryllus longicercus]|uniref:Ribosomal protein eL8/eL30/eS12/Gadd45 domain-containing protein n=1 Tax=Gryllus longicercus TaxID=2509291 RepID=A0AAN9W406_9ORTH